jgi:aspartate aminotransferase
MENILSDRINKLSESATLAMAGLCRELKSQGHNVIDLSLGEPDFNTPDIVKSAAKTAIDNNFTFYTPVSGYLDLRKAICNKLKRDNNLDYTPEQIVVSNGAKHSIANAILCLVNPGDEVLVPAPYWVSYSEIIKLAEGIPVYLEAKIETDFKVTSQQVEAAITPKTKVFLFSSPCNPTGSVYSKDELKRLADVFAKHKNIYIISDEIYEHINFKGEHQSIAQFDFIKENVITINGVSKGFAMTGWRIGYLAAPSVIAKACDKLQGQITSAPSSIAQKAALMAMNADLSVVKDMVKVFKERRDLVLNLLKEIPGLKTNTPEGAFYVYPEVSYYIGKSDGKTTIKSDDDLCMYILKSVQVAMVPGSAFGSKNYIRISYATSNDLLIEAIKRIKKTLSDLK